MLSTGQPELLREGIDLIRKYESSPAANILSPWEIVLLPFSGKYKPGPFALSFDSLISKKEEEKLAEFLVTSPNKILFTDTRIMRGEYEGSLSDHAYLSSRIGASGARTMVFVGVRKVFERISSCYTKVEEGKLISAYVRNDNARWVNHKCEIGPGAM